MKEKKGTEPNLQESYSELKRLTGSILGREERILELKSEVNSLLEELGRDPRYRGQSNDSQEHNPTVAKRDYQDGDNTAILWRKSISSIMEDLRLEIRKNEHNASHLQAIVDSAPAAMVMVNQQGQISLVNTEAQTIFGYKRSELLGQALEILIPERFRDAHPSKREGYLLSPEARRMGAGRDLFAVRKDGSEFPVEIGLNPIGMDDGVSVLSAIIDISERKKLEAQQIELNEELERSNRDLEQFAFMASHDLQTPARNVYNAAILLQKKVDPEALEENAKFYLDTMMDSCALMQDQIAGLLEFSRVVSKTGKNLEVVDTAEMLESITALERVDLENIGAAIEVGELPKVQADKNQLLLVFKNLVDNAIKYRDYDRPLEINVSYEKDGDYHQFSVADNGLGIKEEFREQVFRMFKRLHKQSDRKGTGIGLGLCQKIIERHGGRIWVEGNPGVESGSIFYFILPETVPSRDSQLPFPSADPASPPPST